MSESSYYENHLTIFKKQHPAGEGWRVFIVQGKDMMSLGQLPDFLVEKPGINVVRQDVVPNIQRNWIRKTTDSLEPAFLKAWSWIGDIEILWEEHPIHCRKLSLQADGYNRPAIFMATKSMAAMDGLIRGLDTFVRERARKDQTIKVINGNDIPRPQASWDDLCLPKGMDADIRAATETFFQSKESYLKFGLAYRRGFLFSGPPGCGKTLTLKVIAATTPAVSCVSYSPKEGAREAEHLQEAFSTAENLAPAILMLEDLDKFGRSIPISMILNLLDGLDTPRGVLTIATTNEPERLDPALLMRPSRFDRVWTFSLPDKQQRREFLKKKMKGLTAEAALQEIVMRSEGFSMAYVQEILASAVAFAVRDGRPLEDRDLLRSVEVLRKQIKGCQSASPRIGHVHEAMGFQSLEATGGDRS